MKKIFGFLTGIVLLISCDDGEIALQSFNFDTVSIQKCSSKAILLKTKADEILLINFSSDANFDSAFENTATGDTPRVLNVGTNNQVIYRKYNGNTSSGLICDNLTPANPIVTKEWTASGGTIIIETNPVFAADGVTITSYTHNIQFENINFTGNGNSFSFTNYTFGNYTTSL